MEFEVKIIDIFKERPKQLNMEGDSSIWEGLFYKFEMA